MAVGAYEGEGGGLPKDAQAEAEARRKQAAAGAETGTPSYGSPTPSVINGTGSGDDYLAAAQKVTTSNQTATTTSNTNYYDWANLPVYTGSKKSSSASYSGGIPGPTVDVDTVDAFKNQQAAFFGLDEKQQKLVVNAANAVGGYEVPSTWYQGVYEDALKASSQLYQKGVKKTAWEILADWAGGKGPATTNGPGSTNSSGGGGGGGGGAFSSTTRSVSLTNRDTAERILDAALTNFLGRQASKAEIKMFTRNLNRQEQANPTVTTQAGVSSGNSSVNNQVSGGGVDPALAAEKYAQSRPDYAEYQSATTYMDAFVNALSDPVNI